MNNLVENMIKICAVLFFSFIQLLEILEKDWPFPFQIK